MIYVSAHKTLSLVVEIEQFSVRLNGRPVLPELNLILTERRIGLVGRNGSGKSTLARAMAGLIRPESGHITINGINVWRDRKRAITTVGILFQNPDHQIIFPTVEEELAFGLSQLGHGKREARAGAQAMLARFGRCDWSTRAVATLSQGQRHLVCLMAVLAMQPAVLILDEPFSGLDIPTTRRLWTYLEQFAPAIIQITHDPRALSGYDRVLWLEQGRMVADGPPASVLPDFNAAMQAAGDSDADADL